MYLFVYLFINYFLNIIYTSNFRKWSISFLNLSKLFPTFIYNHFIERAHLLVLAILYMVCPIVAKWQSEIFAAFFCILYDIFSKHGQYPKLLGYLHKYRLFTMVMLYVYFCLLKRINIHLFIYPCTKLLGSKQIMAAEKIW